MMKSENKRAHYSVLIRSLVCGWLLGNCATVFGQMEEQPSEELAPIVLEDRAFLDDPLFGPEYVNGVDEIVAEDDDDNAGIFPDDEADEETYEEKLQRLFFAYREAVTDRMYTEADTLAKEIVELSISVNGFNSRKSATALTNLAVAQHGMEDYASAILNYTAAIGIVERLEDMLASDLINPLRGLGAAYFATGRPDLAKNSFDRAIHISHVNEGPHNLDQIEILLSLAETSLATGDTKDAINIQKRIFYLQARNIEKDSVDIIPALRTRAAWQRRMHAYEEERFTWRRIIKILQSEQGKESLSLIEPLTSIANSYLTVVYINVPIRSQPGILSGEPYLKRAVRISERNPESTLQIRGDAKLELADYHILTDRATRGHKLYLDVWNLLSEDESLLAMRTSTLESGLVLRDIYPPTMLADKSATAGVNKPEDYLSGTVLFSYTVNTRGRATNIRLVEADPVGLDDLYRRIGREP